MATAAPARDVTAAVTTATRLEVRVLDMEGSSPYAVRKMGAGDGRRRRCGAAGSGLALDGARAHAGDGAPLHEQEEGDDGQGEKGGNGHLRPVVGHVPADEGLDVDRQGVVGRVIDQDIGVRE